MMACGRKALWRVECEESVERAVCKDGVMDCAWARSHFWRQQVSWSEQCEPK